MTWLLSGALFGLLAGTAIALAALFGVWWERKVAGRMQMRFGPQQAGPAGILQTLADTVKLVLKEDVTPNAADPRIFRMAPLLVFTPIAMSLLLIPVVTGWAPLDSSVGILLFLAVPSASVIGVLLGGWSSGNTFGTLGGLRGAAQMISYEIPLALSIVGIITLAGSLSLVDIVKAQEGMWFIVKQPLGFLLFLIAVSAETNRTPFDLIECENELVAGYQTEYSSMKFGLFYMAEYAHLLLASCLVTLLFLGGWNGPVLPALVWFGIKLFMVFFVFIWVRATFPRVRYDQLMMFSWKVLTPLAFLNLLVTAVFVVYPFC